MADHRMPQINQRRFVQISAAALVLLAAGRGRAGESAPEKPEFGKHVAPILAARCGKCHGEGKREGSLDLRSEAALLAGGDSGSAVAPSAPEKSELWLRIAEGDMPPEGEPPLTAEEKQVIRRWLVTARFEQVPVAVSEAERDYWAFRTPVKSPLPQVREPSRVRTPVDAFVLAKLDSLGLTMNPEASREKLVRRLYFDLLGLPPSPAEIDEFVGDPSPRAYETLVDRLLASPHYGERWARHWLDVVGYADSNGRRGDETRINSWRYRDYVIRAFNADMPYDQFVTEQLAGDELVDWRHAEHFSPEIVGKLVATGMLRCAPDATDNEQVDQVDDRFLTLHDTVEITMKSLVGLSVGCAKCHNHKYDPIPQLDFYRIEACFTPAYDPQNWLPANKRSFRGDNLRYLPEAGKVELAQYESKTKAIDAQVAEQKKLLEKVIGQYRGFWLEKELIKLPAETREPLRAALAQPAAKRDASAKELVAKHGKAFALKDAELIKQSSELAAAVKPLQDGIAQLEKQRPASPEQIWALWDMKAAPPETHLLRRGNYLTPGRVVEPGVLTALDDPDQPFAFPPADVQRGTSGRRRALAEWLTQPRHPLLARVMVNRIWQHHFGKGLVATPDDFGRQGAEPSHLELLDWLAVSFVEQGWSVKQLHRTILLSSAYRQSAAFDPARNAQDPEGVWLSWKPPLRLEAEAIRDAMLAVGGSLDARMYGAPSAVQQDKQGDGQWIVAAQGADACRRSIYLLNKRTENVTFLNVFDSPVMELNCPERTRSTVPLQALALMNNELVVEQARALAERVVLEAGPSEPAQIELAFRLALARRPDEEELAAITAFLARPSAGDAEAERTALADFCQTLLGTNEFLYID